MKNLFFVLFIFLLIANQKSGYSQKDEFIIGAWLTPSDFMYQTGYGTANIDTNTTPFHIRPLSSPIKHYSGIDYKTSRINILKDFGVELVWMQSPSPWELSGVTTNDSLFRLFANNEMFFFVDIDYYFKPEMDNGSYKNTIGYVDFNGAPDSYNDSVNSNDLGRPNYNKIISVLEENDYTYGYSLGGELANRSGHWYNITDKRVPFGEREDPNKCFTSEISPTILQSAFDSIRPLISSDKKIILQVGTHTTAINDYTDDWRGWKKFIDGEYINCSGGFKFDHLEDYIDIDPQDHFTESDYLPDVLIEGSYYELYLKESEVNGFSYPMNCFEKKYSNMLNCGINPDGYALDGIGLSCPIYDVDTEGRCTDSKGNEFYGDNRHYLSKFHNIDYFRNKGIDVISEFSSFHTEYDKDSNKFISHMGLWNSNLNVDNANHFWFNAYNSVVHGAIGIIPYIEYTKIFKNPCLELLTLVRDLGLNEEHLKYRVFWDDTSYFKELGIESYEDVICDCDENYNNAIPPEDMDYYRNKMATAAIKLIYSYGNQFHDNSSTNQYWENGTKKRFHYEAWPSAFRNYIAPLYDEFSFLNSLGFLKRNDNAMCRKLDHSDPYGIVPNAKDYINSYEKNCVGIPEIYIDLIDTYLAKENLEESKASPVSFMEEFSNENYGLRYVLLTNSKSDEHTYALIITNPLNLPLLNVPISLKSIVDFPNYKYAYLMFNDELNIVKENFHLDTEYKTQRNFEIRYNKSDFSNIPSVKLDIDPINKGFAIDFGPLDTHVILFSNQDFNWCDHSTKRVWSNYNSNAIGGHKLNYNDLPAIVGDYYGDASEELILINLENKWVTTQMYLNGDFTNAFNNSGNGWINRQQEGWRLGSEDVFVAGNFIENSSGDEILCIQDYQNQSTNRVAAMIGFNDNTADWDYWFWSNPNNRGYIGEWKLTGNSKYFVGNFDDDELSEVLFVRYSSGYISHVMIQKYDVSENKWIKLLETKHLDVPINSKLFVGNFYKTHLRDDIFITNGHDASLYLVSGGMLNKYWDNRDFPGYLNIKGKTSWELSSADYISSGLYVKNTKLNSDNLLLVRDPLYEGNENDPSAALFYFNAYNSSWEVIWDNNLCGNNKIADWNVFDNDAVKNDYFSIDIYSNKGGINNTRLFAARYNDSQISSCQSTYIARMYSFNDLDKSDASYKSSISSTAKEGKQNDFIIKPNPTTGFINISNILEYKIESISVFNLYGEALIVKDKVNRSYADINISNLPSGSYFVKIVSEGKYFHEVIIKH